MNDLLTWLGVRHHRYLSVYVLFAISALILLGQQAALAWPLTSLNSANDLTGLSSLSDKTLLTRLAASTLDYGVDFAVYWSQVRIEDLVFTIGAVLLVQKTPPYPTHWILRGLLALDLGLNLGLALVFNAAFSSMDVGAIVSQIRTFGWIYGIGSVLLMAGITFEGIRLCLVRYSD
jgi:hypothetical protein